MSYNLETTELFLYTYRYTTLDNEQKEYKSIGSKRELQNLILDSLTQKRRGHAYSLPCKIERLNITPTEEVTLKEFVPKAHRINGPIQTKYESNLVWNELWNS